MLMEITRQDVARWEMPAASERCLDRTHDQCDLKGRLAAGMGPFLCYSLLYQVSAWHNHSRLLTGASHR